MKKLPVDFKPGMQGLNKILGNLESEIMDIIWRKDCEVCVRDVFEDLAARRKIAYTTVMTIMGRLSDKKILEKRKQGNTSFFIPAMSRDEFTQGVVGNVLDSLLEDFADATLAHFMTRVKSDDRETIEKLEKLLAAHKDGDADAD
ncbi:BlaI/MecI/CopY family transcriptional regulator [Dethiobacter alkaliphilus]|uniref:Transcriptional repressor, CopY family n=1 Tax=Dethiobacter alkaliphilus AHT 1 TaxID=555088 RepID=C0GF11_DETAL|nr:BlaI/MecI/CopY family transcriptional regulator [Dethiobacter alkaliphilus]EEG78193.1 transcriptional repressor, CopY family [Dethiobacter alkaliphilus AHT 1]